MTTSVGRLTVTLPSDLQIVITRSFRAGPRAVFTAWTTPKHVRRWWGSPEAPLVVCDIDLRVGGRWRYVSQDVRTGTELGWHGVYSVIERPRRLVSTEVFEGYPDGRATDELILSEDAGTTTATITVSHTSKANRDAHVASGMETGMCLTLARLDEVLAMITNGADDDRRR